MCDGRWAERVWREESVKAFIYQHNMLQDNARDPLLSKSTDRVNWMLPYQEDNARSVNMSLYY